MIKKKHVKLLSLAALFLAGLLKCMVFLQNRSLFLDELNLSRNIVEKSYAALFLALDYEQFCPPFYACVVKFCTQLFGVNEFSLRLFPLLLGLGSLYLFYRISEQLFTNIAALYPILLFGFSIFMLRYNTENKQYSADVFFSLLFVFIGLTAKITSLHSYLSVGLLGMICIWFSMPLVFILSGLGVFLFYKEFEKGTKGVPNFKGMLNVSVMVFLWLFSFGLLFYINLKESIGSKYLQDYHVVSYLKLPTSIENIEHSYAILRNLLSSMVGHTVVSRLWAFICILFGLYRLVKNDIGKSILILLPIAVCFFASLIGQFILIPRVCLFLMPFVFILIGLGAAEIYEKIKNLEGMKKNISLVLILVPICLNLLGRTGVSYFVKEYELEHSRPVLQGLEKDEENHLPVFVIHNGIPAYEFYTKYCEPQIKIPASFVQYGVWSDDLSTLAMEWKAKGIHKIWLFDSHTFGDELKTFKRKIQEIGSIEKLIQEKNADCYLIELN